ncbi:MAG: hypothetical protein VXZ83_05595 [Verrucomicrobiota bacterium]|nr:hypothetical protein [Verrucomicrobiota bacterium]
MKSLIAGLLLTSVVANASITLSGTSIVSTEISGYTTGLYVASNSSTFDVSLFTTPSTLIGAGTSFDAGTDLSGYTVLGSTSVFDAGPNGVIFGGITYDLGGSVSTGNEIGILAFASSSDTASAGDTFLVFAGDYTVPSDGANLSWTGTGAPASITSSGSGLVPVPEPSAFATLAGICALGFVMLRRRG